MRNLLNAVLSFGLITVPVGIGTTGKRKETRFRTLHDFCGVPVNQQFFCPKCEKTILGDETTKGFEFVKGSYVKIDPDELDKYKSPRSNIISLSKFVPFEKINQLYIEKSYYLIPNKSVPAPYALLTKALEATEKVGIASASLWGNEYPCAIMSSGDTLLLSMLYCFDEVQPIDFDLTVEVADSDQALAIQLVEALSKPLDLNTDFVSESRDRIAEFVEAKVHKQEVLAPEKFETPEVTIDITNTLKESIAKAKAAA